MAEWQPIETAPKDGKFLVARYAPTAWEYWVTTVRIHAGMGDRHREMQLKYARAWAPIPDAPDFA